MYNAIFITRLFTLFRLEKFIILLNLQSLSCTSKKTFCATFHVIPFGKIYYSAKFAVLFLGVASYCTLIHALYDLGIHFQQNS